MIRRIYNYAIADCGVSVLIFHSYGVSFCQKYIFLFLIRVSHFFDSVIYAKATL
jgi:hypothetical protein